MHALNVAPQSRLLSRNSVPHVLLSHEFTTLWNINTYSENLAFALLELATLARWKNNSSINITSIKIDNHGIFTWLLSNENFRPYKLSNCCSEIPFHRCFHEIFRCARLSVFGRIISENFRISRKSINQLWLTIIPESKEIPDLNRASCDLWTTVYILQPQELLWPDSIKCVCTTVRVVYL